MDTSLWVAGGLADMIMIGILIYRRLWRSFPVFFLYMIQVVIGGAGAAVILHFGNSASSIYTKWYLAETIVDSIVLLSLLVEVAWSILRPVRTSLSRRALIPVIGVVLAVGAIVWPFTALPSLTGASQQWHLIAHLQQTVSIVQIVFFLALVACSQLLSLSWRDRELQIATGLGFLSIFSISTAVLQMHGTSWIAYRHLYRIEVGAYLCMLLYWAYCFSQKEAERRQFTPEMQRILLSVAGAAHSTRIALTEPQAGKPRQ